jgi:hypothetical protein
MIGDAYDPGTLEVASQPFVCLVYEMGDLSSGD